MYRVQVGYIFPLSLAIPLSFRLRFDATSQAFFVRISSWWTVRRNIVTFNHYISYHVHALTKHTLKMADTLG